MKILIFLTFLVVLIQADGVDQYKKMLDRIHNLYPDSDDTKLAVSILNCTTSIKTLKEVLKRHKTFNNFNEVLDDLKKTNAKVYENFKPKFEKIQENYKTLSTKAKAWVDQGAKYMWPNLVANAEGSKLVVFTENEAMNLQDLYQGLVSQDFTDIGEKFPLVAYFQLIGANPEALLE